MHRLIMNTPDGMDTDHINSNGLDNRRQNLRICTHAENLANRKKQISNTSGYKGVSWDKSCKKWAANISICGKYKKLGRFTDLVEAARAYDAAAKEVYGEFAKPNFIQKIGEK
jgi:flagellar basal body rod protein FlgC